MEQFLKVAKNITRCTYTPNEKIEDISLFIDPENMKGTPVSRCPIEVRKVDFLPRSVYEPIAQAQGETDEAEQKRRILARDGAEMLEMFESRWIPFERNYEAAYGVRESCTYRIHT